MDQGTCCADRNTMAMLAIAKSLPDALKVVVTSHSEATEDGLLQLHIGLDGASHIVSFRHGMLMDQLKEKVLKITGIPVEEQMYVFAEDARLVDVDALVPLDEPLRCIRSKQTSTTSDEATDVTDREDSSDKDSSEMCKDHSEPEKPFKESSEGSGESKWPRASPVLRPLCKKSWADLSEEADGVITWADVVNDAMAWELESVKKDADEVGKAMEQQKPCAQAVPVACDEPVPAQGSSLARHFTDRWRKWDEGEHQHQFYIAIPEGQTLEFQVVPQIKEACPRIYKANVMVRLRGRGSGFLEGRRRKESTDPLMICISGRTGYTLVDYWDSFFMIASLLEDEIYARYNRTGTLHMPAVHLDDCWVHGGIRLHGEAKSLVPTATEETVEDMNISGATNLDWAREFTEAWRVWDDSQRQHQFYIEIPEAYRDQFQVVRRIKNACRSIFSDKVILRCRGRGSGFIEGRHKAESTDHLMICLSGRGPYSVEDYWGAFYKLASFLEDDLYADYNAVIAKYGTGRTKPAQLHLNYNATHGGVRKGGRVGEPA